MEFVIINNLNTTQKEFEELLYNNSDTTELDCRERINIIYISQLNNLKTMRCYNIKPSYIGYMPNIEYHCEENFRVLNHRYYKIRLLQADLHRKLGKANYGGFIVDLLRLIEKLIIS